MTSFKIPISPQDRCAGRFMSQVRLEMLKAALDAGVSSEMIAEKLKLRKETVDGWLMGTRSMSLRNVSDVVWAIGLQPKFSAVIKEE